MESISIIFAITFFVQGPIIVSSLFPVSNFDVKFYLHTREVHGQEIFPSNPQIWNTKAPLVLITHGWMQSINSSWVKELTKAFLEKSDCNVITVDWSKISQEPYTIASIKLLKIGKSIHDLLIKLADNQHMNLAQAHLIGHSLGAQLMGSVCRNLDLQHKIGRLTGLDPVEPMFNIFDELKPSDADLVVNIHTSTILETLRKNSDIDFIPNGRSGTQLDPLLPSSSITLESFLRNTYNQVLRLLNPDNPSTPSYNITYKLYSRQINGSVLNAEDTQLLDDTKPLYFIIHGWMTNNFTWMVEMKDALLKREDCDVILVEWPEESNIEYIAAAVTTKYIGQITGCLIDYIHKMYSTNLTTIHLIGHSLGAHVAGNVGRTAKNLTGIPVGRLTGLDPAGPLFNFVLDDVRLRKTDAELVDVIHTDALFLGTFRDLGNVHFLPNGGTPPQPGCEEKFLRSFTSCSHSRSREFYTEAILNEKAFLSTLCSSYTSYLEGECNGNNNITIGGVFGVNDSGSYYCKTKSSYPYSYS